MKQESILSKIKKLKDSAASYSEMGNEQAAKLYADKVQALLIKNKLSISDVNLAQLEIEDPMNQEDIQLDGVGGSKRVGWVCQLATIISRAHFCDCFCTTGKPEPTICGRKSDREVALFVFDYLLRQMIEAEKRAARQTEYSRGFKTSFYRGFIYSIGVRYEEMMKAAKSKSESDSTALVKASNAATLWMKKNYKTKKVGRRRVATNGDSFAAGIRAGNSADLSRRGIKSGGKSQLRLG